ncbi:immunoglobulin-like domain-containing protein [Paenisporosarcina cavernae]|uniref:Bacterial Ig-like domain-containing protein n=1 Tax=Paenisporosarcina cavernae TaxID=2320858 RepID=A0A385YU36_9BACL|nr:immunoglobulin-like domain-containing protein [Paenisporosarcina cavernae]AYC28993.1 hypothetical protein D3873_03565 [Paenisporosarcina cavernae]
MKKGMWMLIASLISLSMMTGCSDSKEEAQEPSEPKAGEPTSFTTVNDVEGVTMEVKKDSISATGVTIVFENTTDEEYTYGEDYWLEKKVNDKWTQLPILVEGNWGFNAIGYQLDPHDKKEWKISWNDFYGEMEPGDYRMVKSILLTFEAGGYDKSYLAAEFTIE